MNKLQEVSSKIQAARAELQEIANREGKVAVAEAFREAFAKHPEVVAVEWTQYTPHFNDGEACVFRVYEPELFVAGPKADEDDEDDDIEGELSLYDWSFEHYYKGNKNPRIPREAGDAFLAVWESISDEDVLMAVFGDHRKIRITATAIESEEYDHD